MVLLGPPQPSVGVFHTNPHRMTKRDPFTPSEYLDRVACQGLLIPYHSFSNSLQCIFIPLKFPVISLIVDIYPQYPRPSGTARAGLCQVPPPAPQGATSTITVPGAPLQLQLRSVRMRPRSSCGLGFIGRLYLTWLTHAQGLRFM